MNQEVKPAHAKLSPSSSDRWLACPASIARAPETEDEGSEYAREGTAAHAFAEYCLKNNLNAHDKMPICADWEAYKDADFCGHVQTYLDYVRQHLGEGSLFIEQKLKIVPQYEVWGTADAVIVSPDGVIHIIDLKFGKGVMVEADSTQLLLYGIGALTFDWLSPVPVHTVVAHIAQPRRNNMVSKQYKVEELAGWVKENDTRMSRAFRGVDEAAPGTHCKYCPVKSTCRERAEANLKLAAFDFAAPEAECPKASELSEPELVEIFLHMKRFRAFLDDIEAEVAKRAHDHDVVGLKWVPGRVTRVFRDVEAACKILRDNGINPMSEPTMLGITAIEKLVKEKGLKVGTLLGSTLEVVAGKPALVPASDPRDAVPRKASAADDFSEGF